ncbi:MAG: SCO family protein [Candidatus Binatia bacterium]|nr:SCO family protein [Candidatus Binatia bacterium]
MNRTLCIALFSASLLALATVAVAQPTGARRSILSLPEMGRPAILRDVAFDQRLGDYVPLDVELTDEQGLPVTLGDYLGKRPIVLLPAYYSCPMLCPLTIEGAARALKTLPFDAGTEFDVVVFSFDPEDTTKSAARQKTTAVARYGREDGTGWHFLTGTPDSIERLTKAIGYRYALDEKSGEYAHPAGLVVLTPTGQISRYLFGLDPSPRDLRLALVESSEEKIGSPVDQVLLFCLQYDPKHGKYSAVALDSMRLLAAATVAGLGLFIGAALWRERRKPKGGT